MSHSSRTTTLLIRLVPLALLAVGIATFAYLISTPRRPSGQREDIPPRRVRVFRAKKGSHRMEITAYGTSRASRDWTAIAEVSGRAIEVSDRFEAGEILPADMWLVRIDPTDYQLAKQRLEAEKTSQEMRKTELDQREENLKKIQGLQEEQLRLAERELKRLDSLADREAVSQSMLDVAQSAVVTRAAALQETQNAMLLIPVERELLEASLQVIEVQLEQSQRQLDKCELRLPFAARCASKSVEANQFVSVGERLGTFLALDEAEVVAMVETHKMRDLFPRGIPELGTLDLTEMDLDESVFELLEIPAEVCWGPWEEPQIWHGQVARLGSGLDAGTRALPVIIRVPDPYKDVRPGVRPPLVPDVFCQVILHGATVDDVVVIPRECLRELPHEGQQNAPGAGPRRQSDYCVYLVEDGKLHIAQVDVLAQEEDAAVIESGIDDGDLVVLTDLSPASEGMPLEGEIDSSIAPAPAAHSPDSQPPGGSQPAPGSQPASDPITEAW